MATATLCLYDLEQAVEVVEHGIESGALWATHPLRVHFPNGVDNLHSKKEKWESVNNNKIGLALGSRAKKGGGRHCSSTAPGQERHGVGQNGDMVLVAPRVPLTRPVPWGRGPGNIGASPCPAG